MTLLLKCAGFAQNIFFNRVRLLITLKAFIINAMGVRERLASSLTLSNTLKISAQMHVLPQIFSQTDPSPLSL